MKRLLLVTSFVLCLTAPFKLFAQDFYLGEIKWVPYNFAPSGWAFCHGQLLPINTNQALFSLLGTTYGGNGITSFALPDMRGRVMIHAGQGPGLSNYQLGATGGQETVTLTEAQIPSHQHALNASTTTATETSPEGNLLATKQRTSLYASDTAVENQVELNAQSVAATGGGQPHENRQPYVTLNCIIAVVGIFPSQS